MMKYLKGLLPALLALGPSPATAKSDPIVETTEFKNELVNLLYFDDSSVALVQELDTGHIYRSNDAGKAWKLNKELEGGLGIIKNPYDNNVAIVLGDTKHYITYDQGEKWTSFETEFPATYTGPPISWHSQNNKKIMVHEVEDCFLAPCLGTTYYTEDGFKSKPKVLTEERRMCQWAKGSERFLEGEKKHDSRVLCITKGKYSDRSKDFRLLVSDDYFQTTSEPVMSSGRTVQGMANMAAVKGYLVVAAKGDSSSELALYITQDTETWHHARFGVGKLEEDAYTVLESTNYSIQVDVMSSKSVQMGTLYTSNSNGTYFTKNVENTNRNSDGYVDFEKVANIQGVVLVNIVNNAEKVKKGAPKQIESQISFDDGRSFEPLLIKGKDDKLHLHSVTNLHNSGRVFSSPAPGIVMGVGNTGKELGKYTDGDTYVSDDAGLTWELALEGPHKYEFGDQGSILVAVFDKGDTDKIMYSLKHGRKGTWEELDVGYQFRARELTTLSDSTTLKFMMYASKKKKGGGREHVIVHLDFSGLKERKCDDKDFDSKWSVRVDKENDPSCVMGHKQLFRRRKWDADCFVQEPFNDPVPTFEPCECDDLRDFECDYNFEPEGTGKEKKCVPSPSLALPKGACQDGKKTYMGSSGWRKIPGNQCKGGSKKDDKVERKCDEADIPPPKNDEISSEITKFKGSEFVEHYYLERPTQASDDDVGKANAQDKDETVVMLTDEHTAWITHDHGKKWKKAVDDEVVRIYPHQYDNNYVYFLTASKKVFYSEDRGLRDSIHHFEAPVMPNQQRLQIMQFHPKQNGWLIWMGGKDCENPSSKDCHTAAYVSKKNGQEGSWNPLVKYVQKCMFIWREAGRNVTDEKVFCEQHTNEEMKAPLQLISSSDFFEKQEVKFESVVEFALMSEFIIVATKDKEGVLRLDASLDSDTFAEAKFPAKFFDIHQTAYTVLDSSTHAVFLHVTVNPRPDQEYGSIIKSNSNGTSYVMSLESVNRNMAGYVDFEKMQGLEGVAVANVVVNVQDVNNGAKKKKQTRITHNDGAEWEYIKAPARDSDNKDWGCQGSGAECALHIHGYTERVDPREMYSSPTAVGLMLGVGNVGPELGPIGDASTFITTDAGINWKEIKKGSYAWEFGDQGSVIVIVRRGEDVDHVYYSLDTGEKWSLYKFSDRRIRVDSITTVPSDTSLNFLLWGKDGKELVAVNIDFSGLKVFQKKCDLDEDHPTEGDFYLWSPQHPLQPEDDKRCLFGHVAEYHRKKRGAECRTGQRIDRMHNITSNCPCTRRDYECAYNYERKPGGECQLIEGQKPEDPSLVCLQGAREYWGASAYRRIPLTTCEEGQEFDHVGTPEPCPGFEEEFQKKHGISGFGLFMAIVLPFAAAGGIGYYIWRNWSGKFGAIRLGDTGNAFDSDSPLVKWPVAAISGLVAVVAAIPMLIGSLYRMIAGRMGGGYGGPTYTSRSSFARGRGDYAAVDEGELLGEDSDEDV